jgi:hypothetical protein
MSAIWGDKEWNGVAASRLAFNPDEADRMANTVRMTKPDQENRRGNGRWAGRLALRLRGSVAAFSSFFVFTLSTA